MSKDELIVKQALKIEEMKKILKNNKKILKKIHSNLFSIGAPLNDNKLQFNNDQLKWLLALNVEIESINEKI